MYWNTTARRAGIISAAILTFFAIAPSARALSVDLVWSQTSGGGLTGGSSIDALPGDKLQLEVIYTLDPGESLVAHGTSVVFDFDGGNELNLDLGAPGLNGAFEEPSVADLGAGDTLMQLTVDVEAAFDSFPGVNGAVLTFEQATLGLNGLITPGSYVVGSINFIATTNLLTDGADVNSGFFNPGVDGAYDNSSASVGGSLIFGSAAVNLVPEPSTAMLVGFGLLGLLAVSRRAAGR